MLSENLRLRSFMFLPAYNRKFLDKAITSDADALILDMEDSVPTYRRKEARAIIIEYCEKGLFKNRKNIFVRINPIGTDDFISDVSDLMLPDIDGFVPSKIDDAKDIEFLDRLFDFFERKKNFPKSKFKLAPLIETTKAVENLSEIAKASGRLVALCLGGEDYLNDLGSIYIYQQSALSYPRAKLVNVARANGLLPIDTPYLDIKDEDGFRANEKLAYQNGFAGCLILNPRQIVPANEVFTPDEEKIQLSRRIAEAIAVADRQNGAGVVLLDDSMVGPPMRKRAEAVLQQIGEL